MSSKGLRRCEKLVIKLAIVDWFEEFGCSPTLREIAARVYMSRTKVSSLLEMLEATGDVWWQRKFGRRVPRGCTYVKPVRDWEYAQIRGMYRPKYRHPRMWQPKCDFVSNKDVEE